MRQLLLRGRSDMDVSKPVMATQISGQDALRELPREVPVSVVLDGSSAGVLMCSPAALKDLAIGFSRSEGSIASVNDIVEYEEAVQQNGIEARLWLKPGLSAQIVARGRVMAGPVGCGMCGLDSLEQAMRPLPTVAMQPSFIPAADIMAAPDALRARQPLHDKTRAAHAAGFCVPGQGVVMAREDVGRHNALDKLIGALMQAGIDPSSGAFVMTSRLSLELVQKCAMVGCGVIVAVSSPTADAVAAADQAGITTVGFAHADGFEVFSHPERVA